MASGNPRLATWLNGTLYLYELVGGSFTQISTRSLTNTAVSNTPDLRWAYDSSILIAGYEPTAGDGGLTSYNLSLTPIDSAEWNMATNGECNLRYFWDPHLNAIIYSGRFPVIRDFWAVPIAADGTFAGVTSNRYILDKAFLDEPVGLAINSSGQILVVGSGSLRLDVFSRDPTVVEGGNLADAYDISSTVEISGGFASPQFIPGTDLIVYGNKNKVNVASLNPHTVVDSLTEAAGFSANKVRIKYDGSLIFASYADGAGSYNTVVYKYETQVLTKLQEITGFGKLLDLTADGNRIIDAGLGKAYLWNGTLDPDCFIDNSSIMTNVVSGAASQSISDHTNSIVSQPSSFYDTAVAGIATGSINIDNLYVTFLNSSAAFDPTHTTLSQVTNNGTYETTQGGWPAGGIALGVRTNMEEANRGTISYADVEFNVSGGTMSFEHGVIYDATDGRPVLFVSYEAGIAIPDGEVLIFGTSPALFEFIQ